MGTVFSKDRSNSATSRNMTLQLIFSIFFYISLRDCVSHFSQKLNMQRLVNEKQDEGKK